MKTRNNIILLFAAFAIFILTLIEYVSVKKISETRILMDTPVEITVYGIGRDKEKNKQAIGMAFDEIGRVEKLMSSYIPESDISRVNDANGAQVEVSSETVNLIEIAKQVGELTDGAFDVTLGALVDLWGFTKESPAVPDGEAIKGIIAHTGNDKIEIKYSDGTESFSVRLTENGAKLDLGGVAKGYAIKSAAKVLKDNGIKSGLIDAGGDIVVIGNKKDKPFKIGIKSPDDDGMIGVVSAHDTSIVTSGDYERYFMHDGIRYHHILDPKTGYPARISRSVTVITRDATIADALCTALFVMGHEAGIPLVDQLDGVEALMLDAGGVVHMSKGAPELIKLKE